MYAVGGDIEPERRSGVAAAAPVEASAPQRLTATATSPCRRTAPPTECHRLRDLDISRRWPYDNSL